MTITAEWLAVIILAISGLVAALVAYVRLTVQNMTRQTILEVLNGRYMLRGTHDEYVIHPVLTPRKGLKWVEEDPHDSRGLQPKQGKRDG